MNEHFRKYVVDTQLLGTILFCESDDVAVFDTKGNAFVAWFIKEDMSLLPESDEIILFQDGILRIGADSLTALNM